MIKQYCIIYDKQELSFNEDCVFINKTCDIQVQGKTLEAALNYAVNELGVTNIKEVFEL